jgi:hypothetical protein
MYPFDIIVYKGIHEHEVQLYAYMQYIICLIYSNLSVSTPCFKLNVLSVFLIVPWIQKQALEILWCFSRKLMFPSKMDRESWCRFFF